MLHGIKHYLQMVKMDLQPPNLSNIDITRSIAFKMKQEKERRMFLPCLVWCSHIGLSTFNTCQDDYNSRAFLWTYSIITLGCIHSEPSCWKTFISNCVIEIHQYTTSPQWHHCPGSKTPSGYLSIDLEVDKIGENWLRNHLNCWPNDTDLCARDCLQDSHKTIWLWICLRQCCQYYIWGLENFCVNYSHKSS